MLYIWDKIKIMNNIILLYNSYVCVNFDSEFI